MRASTRASARSTSSRSSRSATTTMDDCDRARPDVRRADRRPLRPAGLPLRAGRAPARPRVKLADVRRGQYEGLKAEIDQRGREPDFGPARTASVGRARSPSARGRSSSPTTSTSTSDDVDLAKRIARRVRESGGGLPKVQANGFEVPSRSAVAASRAGLDEPARLRGHAAVAGLGQRSASSPPRTASSSPSPS